MFAVSIGIRFDFSFILLSFLDVRSKTKMKSGKLLEAAVVLCLLSGSYNKNHIVAQSFNATGFQIKASFQNRHLRKSFLHRSRRLNHAICDLSFIM